MDEQEWLECTDPKPMLEFLQGKASDRKLRLFACACCGGVDLVERYLEGNATAEELHDASLDACRGHGNWARYWWGTAMTDACKRDIAEAVFEVIRLVNEGDRAWYEDEGGGDGTPEEDAKYNVDLVRCISGNPFRPVSLNPAWLEWNDGTVRKIAQAIYANRTRLLGDFVPARLTAWLNDPGSIRQWGQPTGVLDSVRLAVLADALEDAGCVDENILTHCRSEGPHVRGCWIVDLLLGKE